MISESDKLSPILAAKDAEKSSDIAHVGGQDAPAAKRGISSALISTAAGRLGGAKVALEQRGFKMSQVAAKAAAKGGRTAAHGHSRHK